MLVVKYGGHALPTQFDMDPVLEAIGDAFVDGDQVVLIHGGGPQIDAVLKSKGLGKERIAGYRVTTPEVFQVVQSVLCGEVRHMLGIPVKLPFFKAPQWRGGPAGAPSTLNGAGGSTG